MSLAEKLLTGILLFCFPLRVWGWDWQTRVTVVVKEQPVKAVCELLEKEYGIHFSYSRELVNLSRKVTITAHNQRLKRVLEDLFDPDDIRFTRVGDQLVLLPVKRNYRTISGYVEDMVTGERLIGATIYSPSLQQGTTTNQYGYFSLTTVKDTNSLIISYVGYTPFLQSVANRGNKLLTISLEPLANLKEVVVSATEKNRLQDQTQMSKVNLQMSEVQAMPKLLGESDVMRTLQSLPGITGGLDGAGGLHVRGGSPDQNLILMDGTPLFNFSHFFGVFSLLNTDVIKNTDLYKGAFPARFGGRLSSVIDITMKEGDMKAYHGDVSIGLISAKFNLEGPIIKNKTSFMVSGRRSYPDLLMNAVLQSGNILDPNGSLGAYFYDINAKVNHIFSPKDRIFLSFYKGEDKISVRQSMEDTTIVPYDPTKMRLEAGGFVAGWGNTIGALRWNHIYGPRLFSNVTINYSRYSFFTEFNQKYTIPAADQRVDLFGRYSSRMQNVGTKIDFDFRPNPSHSLRFGAAGSLNYFKPSSSVLKDMDSRLKPLDTIDQEMRSRGVEMSVYIEDEWKLSQHLFANLGLHMSGFQVEGRFYPSIQPRLGMRYVLPRNWAIKAAYTHMTQYLHLLTNSGASLPTDIWVPSTQRVAPMFSVQVAAGIAKTTTDHNFEFSLEGYFKSMDNMVEYRDDSLMTSPNLSRWDEKVTVGQGWSYGGELMIQKKKGNTTGWIGYTLAWSTRRFPGINRGEIFPYKYDHRHDLEAVVMQKLSKNWEISASWHYTTGAPITLPVASYLGIGNASPWDPGPETMPVDRYDSRYNFRTADEHRLDLSITYSKQKKRWRKTWNLSIYNVYNQKNALFYYLQEDEVTKKRYLNKITILPILPSITYSVSF
ncbi:TonB-dependent receptor [Chitinophaga nivalis]|uniref:TonB-dependent receptor n=1 Tax=Chitinophaga nivalis TaxID=2991709 RepID=A0ABT3ITG2_9BACT|nr:TonB-dependent receptor [Chitinophaga nivalis]MCW3463105.1 TonB-dependent receptor [Chitinophaga nivalis]MCW3487205.1 TonB-dependent receptor [Chitinophaga nivalis]